MNHQRFPVCGAIALAAMLTVSPSLADAQTRPTRPTNAGSTATVSVKISVLPYVEVSLTANQSAEVMLSGAANSTVTTGLNGQVKANTGVNLTAQITVNPAGGDEWQARVKPGAQQLPAGQHSISALLEIVVKKIGNGTRRYVISTGPATTADTASAKVQPMAANGTANGTAGTATITVTPQ